MELAFTTIRNRSIHVLLVGVLLLAAGPGHGLAVTFPTNWVELERFGLPLSDSNNDATGSRNIVSDATHAAGYYANDGTNLFFRLRLDQDPTGTGGQGLLKAFGWGFVIDTDGIYTTYEYFMELDGITSPEVINLWRNTVQGTVDSPSDQSEVLVSSSLLSTGVNYRIVAADTSLNGDLDYFLDWTIPLATFLSATGLSVNSPIRLFGGSSPSAGVLRSNGGDLVGADTLSGGFTDSFTVSGKTATDGAVKFVADLAGSGDVTSSYPGNTLFLRVDDADRNANSSVAETVIVTLTTPAGDTLQVTLTETGANTGIFTGQAPTASGAPVVDSILQVAAGQTVTVTYKDLATASGAINQLRTDTVSIAAVGVNGVVSLPATIVPGDTVTVTVTDADLNTNVTTAQVVNVIVLNPITGEQETVSLTETGVNTGVFSTTLGTALGTDAGSAGDGSLNVAGGHRLVATYQDALTSTGGSATRTATGTVQVPNLAVTKAADRSTALPGQEVLYTVSYLNNGGSSATQILVQDQVPAFSMYVTGSATGPVGTAVTFSHDGGSSFNSFDAPPVTHLRWTVPGSLTPTASGSVAFRVRIQ
jgi:uncharacterized repeat protein (TIGR01451 family)